MFGLTTLTGLAGATATIAIILAEAIVLHVGYGRLLRMTSRHVCRAFED